ncbi:MAG: helix-hairpin-helix domain-containing protein [Bacteroidales bacterium]|nr:helix-hairpin-helix domain-containing protein [Bacteroidales bacterium]
MRGNFKNGLLIILIWIPGPLKAQLPLSSQEMEGLLYRSESAFIPESVLNEWMENGEASLDLNNASPEELEASALFTPYQLHQLLKYREEFGEIYSIQELAVIPGFHPGKVTEISPFVILNPAWEAKEKTRTQHRFQINLARACPGTGNSPDDSTTLWKNAHTGPPLFTCVRIRSRMSSRLSLALTYEKDAGEAFLYKNRPQFLSGYLSFEGQGFLNQIVLGNFKMNQGMGLVNGDGYLHRPGKLRINRQSLSRIRPYASKTESGFEQGLACQFELNKARFLIWTSCQPLSLSPSALLKNTEAGNWPDYQLTSGLYRTAGELEGRGLASRVHAGVQVLYSHRQLALGIMSGTECFFPTRKTLAYLGSDPGTVLRHKASLHGNWQKNRTQFFGEMALNAGGSLASLIGSSYMLNDFIQATLLLHHYGTDYLGSCPSSYASGSAIKNEQGLAFYLKAETGKFISAELSGELFRYRAPRYLSELPSSGNRVDLSLHNPGKKQIQWRLRVVSKNWQSTPAVNKGKLRPLIDSRVSRMDGQIKYKYLDHFQWQSRLVISRYSQQKQALPGYAVMQQVMLCPSPNLKLVMQFVQFRINDWENRIYLYEPGFYYSFSFPSYYGKGQKTTFLLTIKPAPRISISAKISAVTNMDLRKWEASLQWQLKL